MQISAKEQFIDRRVWSQRRHRSAKTLTKTHPLHATFRDSLVARLGEVNRGFPNALVLGTGRGTFAKALRGNFGIDFLVQVDASTKMASEAARVSDAVTVVADEEALPFSEQCFNLAVGGLTLHWANDLVGALVQLRRCLVPDGLFMGAVFGGETLWELRSCLAAAEIEVAGGLSPRVAPMGEIRDLGGALQRAGFALPVADVDRMRIEYPDPVSLMHDLRGLGETNAMCDRGGGLTRKMLARLVEIYGAEHAGEGGGVLATFEIIYLTGWAPHRSQPQPLRPGSAVSSLAEALGTREIPLGD